MSSSTNSSDAIVGHFREMWRYRDFINYRVQGQRRTEVSSQLFGGLWYVLLPLSEVLVYYLLLVVIFRAGRFGDIPYIVGLLAGLLHFNLFQRIVTSGISSITSQRTILLQIKMEPIIFVAIPTLIHLRGMVYYWLIYIGVVILTGAYPDAMIIFYPFVLALIIILSWSVSVISATLFIELRDLGNVIQIVMRFMMYLTPVIYPITMVPERFRDVYLINPVATLFNLVQATLLRVPMPPLPHIGFMIVTITGLFFYAHFLYEKKKRTFTKVI